MTSGDLSSDLNFGILTPTPSVRPAEGHSACDHHPEHKGRRRSSKESQQEETPSPERAEPSEHKLDRLA